jgi:hypothetical protein
MSENWIQGVNRCTGPSLCTCSITGPHQPDNPRCYRNIEAKRQERRDAFDAKVRKHGYVDRVTGERIYDPARLTRGVVLPEGTSND